MIRDTAFQFYYQENIEALADGGAKIMEISAIDEKSLPPWTPYTSAAVFPKPRPDSSPKTRPSAVPCEMPPENGPADLCRMRGVHVSG